MLLPFINFTALGKIISTFIGCGLISGVCMTAPIFDTQTISAPTSYDQQVSVQAISTTSPDVTIVTDVNGKTDKKVIKAPYGVKSSVVSVQNGSSTRTEATTTPLTQQDALKIQHDMDVQMQEIQQEMDSMFAQQQRMFTHSFSDF